MTAQNKQQLLDLLKRTVTRLVNEHGSVSINDVNWSTLSSLAEYSIKLEYNKALIKALKEDYVDTYIKGIERDLLNNTFNGSSTNPYSNALAQTEREVATKFYRDYKELLTN